MKYVDVVIYMNNGVHMEGAITKGMYDFIVGEYVAGRNTVIPFRLGDRHYTVKAPNISHIACCNQ